MQRGEARVHDAEVLGDIRGWMARRRADLDRRGEPASNKIDRISLDDPEPLQQLMVVESDVELDRNEPDAMDLGLRFQPARSGDSISKLIGSSDPRAIGKFLSLNGMDGSSSTLRAGRSYVVPTHWDDATSSEADVGEALLRNDNARLRDLAEKRAAQDIWAVRLLEGRNVWTGEPVQWAGPAPIPALRNTEPQRGGLDDNATAKAAVGALGWGLGVVPGVVRGGFNTIKGAGEGAYFVYQLTSPYPQGQLAREQLLDAGRKTGGYVIRGIQDPSIVRDDIEEALHGFQSKQNPFATPAADTLGGEFKRTFDIGMNNGELAFDVGSLFLGGGAIRGAAGIGATAKAATVKELAYLAANPGLAARFDLPYKGMGHHIVGRNAKLPAFLGGDRYPAWFIESDFNKIRQTDITTRDLYRNHVGVDDSFHGTRIGRDFGGGSWNRKALGWTDYGPLDRLNYGTSPLTKAVVGPILVGGTLEDGIEGEGFR